MALPVGLKISDPVHFLPSIFDALATNRGQFGPVAAIVSYIDTVQQTVSLWIFTENGPVIIRKDIPYYTDGTETKPSFKLPTDPMPTPVCTAEVTSLANTDPTSTSFTFEWENPGDNFGVVIEYREDGIGAWKLPNEVGNLSGNFLDVNKFQFTDAVDNQEYEIRVKNRCNNLATSAGVTITETALPPV